MTPGRCAFQLLLVGALLTAVMDARHLAVTAAYIGAGTAVAAAEAASRCEHVYEVASSVF